MLNQLDWRAFLPVVLVIIDFVQTGVCACYKDYARALYWFSAGLITLATIFMKG